MSPTAIDRRRCLARLGALGAAAAAAAVSPAQAQALADDETEVAAEVARLLGAPARLQGRMRFRWFGLHVYDGRLWSAAPVRAEDYAGREFALELIYARTIEGGQIAERTVGEMRRIADFSEAQARAWLGAMREAFPDVRPGDRLLGLHRPGQGVSFFHNGRPTRAVADAAFAAPFFGIWLSPRSAEPRLRDELLGLRR